MQKSLHSDSLDTTKPVVVIAGRPNVGKSTLFNRLAGKNRAMVSSISGVTRDVRYEKAFLWGNEFQILDTAGIEEDENELAGRMNKLTETAVKTADVILFMLDGKEGVTLADRKLAQKLRELGRPVIVVFNKIDVLTSEDNLHEAYELGFGAGVPISAAHARGMEDLWLAMEEYITCKNTDPEPDITEVISDIEIMAGGEDFETSKTVRLAIVGRPNAGKSTLVNALLNDERMLTGEMAGLTRESVSTLWHEGGKTVELVDTPGIRKKAKVIETLEKMSVTDALKTIEKASGAVLVLDATCPLEHQDLQVATRVVGEGKPLLIALNKWDLVENKEECLEEVKYLLATKFSQVKNLPILQMSALHKRGIHKIMQHMLKLDEKWKTRVSTGKLNKFLDKILYDNPPPMKKGRRLKIKYITQVAACPPTFVLWCNVPKNMPNNYVRYVQNNLAREFDLDGIVVRILCKGSENPYAK